MHILIIAAGSVGDVAPYTGLAAGLEVSGHEVAICTHEKFAQTVRDNGLEFRSLKVNSDPLFGVAEDGQMMTRTARDAIPNLKMLASMVRTAGAAVVEAIEQGTDLVLLSGNVTPLGWHVTEGLGVPSLGVYLVPRHPTSEFPSPVLAPQVRSLGRWGNSGTGRVLSTMTDGLTTRMTKALWTELDLPSVRSRTMRRRLEAESWPVCYGFSPTVLPRPADWRPGLEAVGYWWPTRPPDWEPPPELVDFLDAGPPPVLIGFGSMGSGEGERLSEVAQAALSSAGVRGVIQSGWAGLSVAGDDVLTIGEVPHDWLMPRTALVVHHAGMGTTAAGLRAGVPAVPVPTGWDQPFWARRLVGLGVSPGVLPLRKLRAERLATAIQAVLADPSYRSRAGAIARSIAAEDGAGQVAEMVGNHASGFRPTRPST